MCCVCKKKFQINVYSKGWRSYAFFTCADQKKKAAVAIKSSPISLSTIKRTKDSALRGKWFITGHPRLVIALGQLPGRAKRVEREGKKTRLGVPSFAPWIIYSGPYKTRVKTLRIGENIGCRCYLCLTILDMNNLRDFFHQRRPFSFSFPFTTSTISSR